MRIVSLVPSLTELIYDLKSAHQLVGCTKFCVHPGQLRTQISTIGGTKNVHVDKVRDLNPDLVVASKEENVKEQVEAISQFAEVLLTDVVDLSSAEDTIMLIGNRLGATAAANRIAQHNALYVRSLAKTGRGRALYLIWRKPNMAAGGDTYIHHMMEALGYQNVLAERRRYPELSDADIVALAPRHVLLSSEPYPFAEKHLAHYQQLLPKAQVILVDGELFSWYGSRLSNLYAAQHGGE